VMFKAARQLDQKESAWPGCGKGAGLCGREIERGVRSDG
jgi:hypothetical protein